MAAVNGTSHRYLTMVALNYISSEVHSNFGPLFGNITPERKAAQLETLAKKFAYIEQHMLRGGADQYLVGNKFSVADSYLYIVLGWGRYVGVELPAGLQKYWQNINQLSFVVAAHAQMATNPKST